MNGGFFNIILTDSITLFQTKTSKALILFLDNHGTDEAYIKSNVIEQKKKRKRVIQDERKR